MHASHSPCISLCISQGLDGFVDEFRKLGYSSSWGGDHSAVGYTSFCARTFLQPQLQKAVRITERKTRGDVNLKDFVLFSQGKLHPTKCMHLTPYVSPVHLKDFVLFSQGKLHPVGAGKDLRRACI